MHAKGLSGIKITWTRGILRIDWRGLTGMASCPRMLRAPNREPHRKHPWALHEKRWLTQTLSISGSAALPARLHKLSDSHTCSCLRSSCSFCGAASGPLFHFSDTWQLIINTGTTIITFLVVFLIQNTQNRDAKALHLKLDELIRSNLSARNDMIDIEKLSDEELGEIERRYAAICEESNARRGKRSKTGQNKTVL